MDPKAALSELRELIRDYHGAEDAQLPDLIPAIIERIEAIDQWMTKGGFSPWAGGQ